MSERKNGIVKWFDTARGFGFINPVDEPDVDVFVHYRTIQVDGFKNLKEGQQVTYLQVKSEKGWQAAEVIPVVDFEEDPPHSDGYPGVG